MKKRLFAAFVCLCMIVSLLPTMAFAEAGVQDSGIVTSESGLCEHHTQHDESCGYTEGTAEIPCSHEHDESCGGLTDPEACNHTHDEACGYVPATEGTPCTFVCEVCDAQDSGNPATPSDAQPEECTCETLCTEEEINGDCPVCSAEGAELDKVCVGAALLLTAPTLRTGEIELYVGGQQIKESGCYENQNGTWKKVDGTEPANGQFSYDADTFTLTLNQAMIVNYQDVTVGGGFTYPGSVIAFSQSADVSLTIEVSQGTSNITGTGGIRVVSKAGDASLSISGPGSLEVKNVSNDSGIVLIGSKNVNLGINSADVTISNVQYYGVQLAAGDACKSTATINDGNLTVSDSVVGIYFMRLYNDGPSSLTVSGNAMVDTEGSTGGIINGSPDSFQIGADGESGGIVFNGKSGTVYGNVTLQDDLEIASGETLTVGKDASLTVPDGKTLTNNGTVTTEEGGTLTGSITNAPPKITTTSLSEGTVNTAYNQPLAADNNPTSWSVTNGTLPDGLTLNSDGTISGTPTAAGTYSFTVTATNDYGSDSKEFTLTIDQQGTIHVTSVSLDKASLELTEGETAQLTATVLPDNATNKNVTWSTSNASIATVDANGLVTAVSAGTAVITVTTEDGTKTASCTVTVTVPVTGVTLSQTQASLYYNRTPNTLTLTATVAPDNATNKDVTWTSSDSTVATVDQNGLVTALARGTAVITATTADGGKTASCTVTVSRYSSGGGSTTYAVTAPDVENGTVRVSPSRASRGTTVTITVTPDEGYELESLTVLDSRDNEIALTDKGDGKYTFTMPSGRVTVEASFAEIAPEPLPFGDVDDGDWFADAVRFVYENGMMNGVSETGFAPNAATSRSMIVTILYRLEGEPVVDYAMDFTDVAGDAYYAEAVRWAASEGIVGGYGGGLFGSDDAVTREQLAVILYRYAVYKGYDVSIGEDTNILSYADFADLSEYAIPAMQWACGAGIITGVTDATLVPQGEATRAQVAAMLMRFVEAIG